jgi:hypothetical protein
MQKIKNKSVRNKVDLSESFDGLCGFADTTDLEVKKLRAVVFVVCCLSCVLLSCVCVVMCCVVSSCVVMCCVVMCCVVMCCVVMCCVLSCLVVLS